MVPQEELVSTCDPVLELVKAYVCDCHYNIMILPRFRHSSRLAGKNEVDRLAQDLANTYGTRMKAFAHILNRGVHLHIVVHVGGVRSVCDVSRTI